MNKKDILILSTQSGFNPNQCWITWIPYNYKSVYSKTDKYNGLRLFSLDRNKLRVDYPLYKELEITDFLCKATLEYDTEDIGTLTPRLVPKKLIIGNKSFDLLQYKNKEV